MDPSMWKDGKYVGWVKDAEKRKQYEIKEEDTNEFIEFPSGKSVKNPNFGHSPLFYLGKV